MKVRKWRKWARIQRYFTEKSTVFYGNGREFNGILVNLEDNCTIRNRTTLYNPATKFTPHRFQPDIEQ